MTGKDSRQLKRLLKRGPRMGRKERVEYLRALVEAMLKREQDGR